MRRRIAKLLWSRSPSPQHLTHLPSSRTAGRPLSTLLDFESYDSGRPLDEALVRVRCPQDPHSCCGSNSSSSDRRAVLPSRLTPSSSYCHFASAPCLSMERNASCLPMRRRFTDLVAKRPERRCWSCEHETSTRNGLFCPSCNAIQPLDPTVDFFQIFGIDRSFKVDLKALEQSYKSLQKKLHPDLAGSKSEREREYSAEQSSHVIQAYYILLRPLSRAKYLLRLQGVEIEEEGTIDDPEMLLEIMEIRESVEEISDEDSLQDARAENSGRILNCEKELESAFSDGDIRRAVKKVQRLAYYVKVDEEILRKL